MRDFRLRRPGVIDDDAAESAVRADSLMREWELEEAREAYVSGAAFGPALLGFASVMLLLALTLAVSLELGVGLSVVASGVALSPFAWGWLRRTVVARRRSGRLEAEVAAGEGAIVAE